MSKIVDSPKGGKVNRFEYGESGNPNGRPVGSRNISTVLREYLIAEDKKQGGTGDALNIPVAKLIKLVISANNEGVQLKAIQEAIERLEGKVEIPISMNQIPQIKIDFRDAD